MIALSMPGDATGRYVDECQGNQLPITRGKQDMNAGVWDVLASVAR